MQQQLEHSEGVNARHVVLYNVAESVPTRGYMQNTYHSGSARRSRVASKADKDGENKQGVTNKEGIILQS